MEGDYVIWIAIGIALMGYFIGNGLRLMHHPRTSSMEYYLVEEKDLHTYLNLSREEVQDLLNNYPNVPKIQLNGKNYYNYEKVISWLASDELYQNKH